MNTIALYLPNTIDWVKILFKQPVKKNNKKQAQQTPPPSDYHRYHQGYHQAGFSLIELMIVVAIIGILVAIALPSYQKYTRRAHYAEVVQAAAPFKVGIAECFQTTGTLGSCQAGENGVPEAIPSGQGAGLVDSVTINTDASINVTPQQKYGITTQDNYLLTPSIENNTLIWQSSGGGVTAGYAS